MKVSFFLITLGLCSVAVQAQEIQTQDSLTQKEQKLNEVVVTSGRIALPFSEESRTISIITANQIKNSGATNVADLLQQVAGVDIRRRGTNGSQADLYIRGGSFDQTLLLIDGIKVEDAQTGHHTLNLALPLEVIKRIEIIKGPAARVYGQNAFTGAVNIVTKDDTENLVSVGVNAGSYDQKGASVTVGSKLKNSSHLINYSRNISDGYRYNTDYDNQNIFLKSRFNENAQPIELLATIADKKFGANGFYATPEAKDQYEETQASLVGVSTTFKGEKLTVTPRMYWRRNQDLYLYVRNNPPAYRNLHITNKVGAEVNASYTSKLGVTGFGVDLSKVYISSNNLGDHNRFMGTIFLEHQFKLFNNKFDVTPGVALNYFSDFDAHAFPGIDLGFQLTKTVRLYGNVGYTYRIPTYTDLYYASPTTLGNADLKPEEAVSEEFGVKFNQGSFRASAAFFNRSSQKLIDYVKENEGDLWQAQNIRDVNTKGIEANAAYVYYLGDLMQRFDVGYTYLDDDVQNVAANYSQYSINSLKHNVTLGYTSSFVKGLSEGIFYRYAERTSGDCYKVVDANVTYDIKDIELSFMWNNIFNEAYTETNLVPMPKSNVLFGLRYTFK
ncbi:TonB-dependent receptor plug domain-containing protein [Zhouia sp. PK063]|uniref:TonB-dependent receptor plug domain-containing protein n=1 Tax=Zhouia sp. PK063 TaxID=3373602 RepID=UPI0037B369D4